MKFQKLDLANSKHRSIAFTIQKLSSRDIDFDQIAINEESQIILCDGNRYYYDFQKIEGKKYCVLYNRDKEHICSFLSSDISSRIKGKKISSLSGRVQMAKNLAVSLAGVGMAAALMMGYAHYQQEPSSLATKVSSEMPRKTSHQTIYYVPKKPDHLENSLTSGEIQIEPDFIDGNNPPENENFATIQTGDRREGAKYFSNHRTIPARDLLKARNTMEFMGDEITYWSNHFGLDPKFVIALFSMERPWLPMDNDLVDESYSPTYFGKDKELNVAQITNGARSVYKVPTFENGQFLGYEIYDFGTGSGQGRQINIDKAKENRSLSIEAGCALLAYHMTKYQGNAIYAALAYNTGEDHVNIKISEEEFFRNGNPNSLDDRTYASDMLRYMFYQGIVNCNFSYVDKNTGQVKFSKYDFDTTGRQLNDKGMNLHAATEILRLSKKSFSKYLAKYGNKGVYYVESIPKETSITR